MANFLKSNWGHILLVTVLGAAQVVSSLVPQLAPFQGLIDKLSILLGVTGTAALPQINLNT